MNKYPRFILANLTAPQRAKFPGIYAVHTEHPAFIAEIRKGRDDKWSVYPLKMYDQDAPADVVQKVLKDMQEWWFFAHKSKAGARDTYRADMVAVCVLHSLLIQNGDWFNQPYDDVEEFMSNYELLLQKLSGMLAKMRNGTGASRADMTEAVKLFLKK